MFRDVPGCSGMFRDVPGCSGMFRDVPGCSGMFRNVSGCSMFLVLSTAHDAILQRYSIMFRSDKHSLKDDFSFQLDIGHYEQINARSKMCFDDQ